MISAVLWEETIRQNKTSIQDYITVSAPDFFFCVLDNPESEYVNICDESKINACLKGHVQTQTDDKPA